MESATANVLGRNTPNVQLPLGALLLRRKPPVRFRQKQQTTGRLHILTWKKEIGFVNLSYSRVIIKLYNNPV